MKARLGTIARWKNGTRRSCVVVADDGRVIAKAQAHIGEDGTVTRLDATGPQSAIALMKAEFSTTFPGLLAEKPEGVKRAKAEVTKKGDTEPPPQRRVSTLSEPAPPSLPKPSRVPRFPRKGDK